ncbi:MAG: restriction endonuclease subunit S, partial [Bacilli bacterium]|nr:restriction endonuclease subunit S [Bacilli bacterium]
ESATVLLDKIRAEKAEKIKKGELKADKKDSFIFVGSDKRHYEQFADGTVKDIEDEIPFAVPEGWAWCRLKEVCELKGGKRIPAGLSATKEKTNHIYIRVTDMQNNSISDADLVYITDDIFEKIQRYTINKDDLYLTIAGTIGRVGEVPEIFDGMNLTENALKLTNISICKKYLMQILNTKLVQDYFESTYHQVAMPKLSLINASKTIIPVPPLDEQQKIVNEIDNVFSITNNLDIDIVDLEDLITRTKSKILDLAIHGKLVPQNSNDEPAEELLKRIATSDNRPYKKFEEAVLFEIPKSWSWCYLHTISALLNGDRGENYPSKKDYVEYGIPFINAGCLDNGNINYDVANYITEEKYNSLRAGKIQKSDILYCLRGSLGKTGFVITDNKGAISSSLCIFRLNESVIPQYFLYVLNSNAIKVQQKMVDNGTAQPNLSAKDVSNYQIPLPPLAEQYRIVTKIEELFEKLDIISN